MTVFGWHGKPSNKALSDQWADVNKSINGIDCDDARANDGVRLHWYKPFEPKPPVPTSCLYSLAPDCCTIENLRHVRNIPYTAKRSP